MSELRYLDFEEPLRELDEAIAAAEQSDDRESALRLRRELAERVGEITAGLSAWQRVQLSRHVARPQTLEYVSGLCSGFVELHGDRRFGDDAAIVAGLGFRGDRAIGVVGQQRGRDTASRLARRFGMPGAEGYRKARRVYRLAGRFGLPLLTLVDTPGAYPGRDSEERGVAEAIAACLAELVAIPVPVVSVVIGEGGSGGALALAVADVLLVLEHAYLSVITPEGCASILARDRTSEAVARAASSLALTSGDLARLGIVDAVVMEPAGGAHRDPMAAVVAVGAAIDDAFALLDGLDAESLRARRRERLRRWGDGAAPKLGRA